METIIPNGYEKNIEIRRRAFDGLYNVWQRYVEWNKDKTYSIIWQVIGVSDSFDGAIQIKQQHKRKTR